MRFSVCLRCSPRLPILLPLSEYVLLKGGEYMNPIILAATSDVSSGGSVSGVVTEQMLQGVLNEVINLLPVCLPVMITFIGIRKGIAFVRSMLQSA